jgi:hypothetical protein
MRWLLAMALVPSLTTAYGQTLASVPSPAAAFSSSQSDSLPDAPGAPPPQQESVVVVAESSFKETGGGVGDCNAFRAMLFISLKPNPVNGVRKPCSELVYPYQQFLSTNVIIPMTWQQKGLLALHDLTDLENFGTIVGISAITVGADSHNVNGPGLKGFGRTVGISLLQDATGQFFGAFAVPSLAHQDPRYFRMPHASIPRRIVYSISRSFVSRHDEGGSMPNYAVLVSYPVGAEIANLYVPGIHPDAASTVDRILTGYATDPANNLLNEFLPDVAKRVHVRIIFVQRILNNIAATNNGVSLQ